MGHYINILLLPDPEIPVPVLMSSLYSKLHRVLCDLKSTDIGISFPKYRKTLGNLLRVHGKPEALSDLQRLDWIGPMRGYCEISDIIPVPSQVNYCTVSRIQPTMSPAKLRRLIKRGTIDEKEAIKYKAKMFSKDLCAPYVDLMSTSTGHRHRRYMTFGPLQDKPAIGRFDQFGLSSTATVPWF